MTPVTYKDLTEVRPFTVLMPCQASLPLVTAELRGEWEKFSF